MHPYLNRLGVPLSVQHFFEPYFTTDVANHLLFAYGDAHEHYGQGLHCPPLTAAVPWIAGTDGGLITQVFVCSSAMEAIAYLTLYHARYPDLNALYFCALSASLPVALKLPKAKSTLLFENSLSGKLWDIKIACLIRRKPVRILYDNQQFIFHCQNRSFSLAMDKVSLSAFEQAAGIRTGIRTAKAKGYSTFFEQLTH